MSEGWRLGENENLSKVLKKSSYSSEIDKKKMVTKSEQEKENKWWKEYSCI